MLEYRVDQIKIVDFLLLAKFWACLLFFPHPLEGTFQDFITKLPRKGHIGSRSSNLY